MRGEHMITRQRAAGLGIALAAAAILVPRLAVAFEPYLNAIVLGTTRPLVSGETNLPDGSEIMVAVARKETPFSAQAKAVVAGGRFKTEPFSDNGKDLAPGRYDVAITMSMAAEQPAAVQSVVGKHGEKLTGKLVKLGPFGVYLEQDLGFTVAGK